MKLKRIAVRAAVALFVVVGLCMFFGRTVLTLTTPKVTLVDAQNGRLEDKIPVKAELFFAKPEHFTVEEAKDLPVTIDRVYVSPGDEVKKGDTLFTARVSSKYEELYEAQLKLLSDEQKALIKLEMANTKTPKRNTYRNDLEDQLYALQEEHAEKLTKLTQLAADVGVALKEDPERWIPQLSFKLTTEMVNLMDEMDALKASEKKVRKKLVGVQKKVDNDGGTYEYLKSKREQNKKIDNERAKLMALVEKAGLLKTARAPRDGVVVSVDVKEGEGYAGDKAAYALSSEAPVLRADISDVRKEITKDLRVEYKADYETVRTNVVDVKREAGNKKYAIIELTDQLSDYVGGIRGLTQLPIDLNIIYKSRSNATLVPTGALRGEENNRHVLVAEQRYSMWGNQLVARKVDVRVLEMGDRLCAISEDLGYQKIITQPNAQIDDGSRVMEYIQ